MSWTRALFLMIVVPLLVGTAAGADISRKLLNIFAGAQPFSPANRIDRLVSAELQKHGIQPANLCSDPVFIRRVYIDLTGTLPEPHEVRAFLDSPNPDKRSALIDKLMEHGEFADYWTMKWCDLLRVKAEFPINLWPNGVQAYARWIHDAVRSNMPYDQFVRELLTSSGSNFRVPPVNFYRAMSTLLQDLSERGLLDSTIVWWSGEFGRWNTYSNSIPTNCRLSSMDRSCRVTLIVFASARKRGASS